MLGLVLELELIEPHRHTAGRLIPDSRRLVILVLICHNIMSEEYKLCSGLDGFRME